MPLKSKKNNSKKLSKKDYDKDGKMETPEQEYKGARGNAIRKSKGNTNKKAKGKKGSLRENFNHLINTIVKKQFGFN